MPHFDLPITSVSVRSAQPYADDLTDNNSELICRMIFILKKKLAEFSRLKTSHLWESDYFLCQYNY